MALSLSDFLIRTDALEAAVPVSEAALYTAAEVIGKGRGESAASAAALAVALRLRPKSYIQNARLMMGDSLTDAALRLPIGIAEAAYVSSRRIDQTLRCAAGEFLTLTKQEQLLTLCAYIACTKILTAPWRNPERPALGYCSSATPFAGHIAQVADIAQRGGLEAAGELAALLRFI